MTVAAAPRPPAGPRSEQPYVARSAQPRRTGLWLGDRRRSSGSSAGRCSRAPDTLALGGQDLTAFHQWLNERARRHRAAPRQRQLVLQRRHRRRSATSINWRRRPAPGADQPRRPSRGRCPQIGWLGVVALFAWIAYARRRLAARAVLVVASLLAFGFLGYWAGQHGHADRHRWWRSRSACVIGMPLGIWMARSKRSRPCVTPVLDLMQTMPSFAYLRRWRCSSASAPPPRSSCTLIYALPPLVRITAHGIRDGVGRRPSRPPTRSGVTTRQLLRKVQLPMARRTIVVGINQSTMAALSMATIAAFINGPGLGQPVVAGAAEPRRRRRRRRRPRDRA